MHCAVRDPAGRIPLPGRRGLGLCRLGHPRETAVIVAGVLAHSVGCRSGRDRGRVGWCDRGDQIGFRSAAVRRRIMNRCRALALPGTAVPIGRSHSSSARPLAVILGRWTASLRALVPGVAGMSRLGKRRFTQRTSRRHHLGGRVLADRLPRRRRLPRGRASCTSCRHRARHRDSSPYCDSGDPPDPGQAHSPLEPIPGAVRLGSRIALLARLSPSLGRPARGSVNWMISGHITSSDLPSCGASVTLKVRRSSTSPTTSSVNVSTICSRVRAAPRSRCRRSAGARSSTP